jgi:hypothetical protein
VKKEKGHGESRRAVLLLDCWYGHIDPDFRRFVREQYPWLLILYIPAACTSKLQPCDLVLNRTVKHEAAEAFSEMLAEAIAGFAGTSEERTAYVRSLLATSTLKPLLPLFLRRGLHAVQEQREAVAAAWKSAGWLEAWKPAVLQRAKQHRDSLFPGADWRDFGEGSDTNAPSEASEPRETELPSSTDDGLVQCAVLEEQLAAMAAPVSRQPRDRNVLEEAAAAAAAGRGRGRGRGRGGRGRGRATAADRTAEEQAEAAAAVAAAADEAGEGEAAAAAAGASSKRRAKKKAAAEESDTEEETEEPSCDESDWDDEEEEEGLGEAFAWFDEDAPAAGVPAAAAAAATAAAAAATAAAVAAAAAAAGAQGGRTSTRSSAVLALKKMAAWTQPKGRR